MQKASNYRVRNYAVADDPTDLYNVIIRELEAQRPTYASDSALIRFAKIRRDALANAVS